MSELKILKCEKCGGEMSKKREAAHSQGVALVLILAGVLLIFFLPVVGTVLGIVVVLVGIVRGSGLRYIWLCNNCGYRFEFKPTMKDRLRI